MATASTIVMTADEHSEAHELHSTRTPLDKVDFISRHTAIDEALGSAQHDASSVDCLPGTAPTPALTTADEAPHPMGAKFWLILSTLAAVLILSAMDNNIVATAVPSITNHFHSVADVGWYSSVFRLCLCAFQFIFGKAYRLFSIKKVFLLANCLSIIGSLLCGAAASSKMLIVGRAIAGLGSAGLQSGCFVILVQITDLRRRPMFTGILGAVDGVSSLAAPIIGGGLTQTVGWRWCFYINAPLAAAALILTIWCFPDPPLQESISRLNLKQKLYQLDVVSNLIFIPALTALFLALSWAGTKYPWGSAEVIAPLVTFLALMAAFIYNQFRRADAAALPPRILKRRSVIAGFIFIAFSNGAGQVIEYYLPTYYQVVRDYSPAQSSYLLLPYLIIGTIGTLIHGFGTSAIGYYTPFMLFASVITPIAGGLITTLAIHTSLVKLIVYTGLAGLASGIGFSGPQNAVQTVLPHDDIPLGTSIMLFAQSIGPAVAVAIAQVLFTNQLSINLGGLIPGFNVNKLGLSQIVTSVPTSQTGAVLEAIDKSLSRTWYLAVGLGCATIIGSSMMEWRSVKTRRD